MNRSFIELRESFTPSQQPPAHAVFDRGGKRPLKFRSLSPRHSAVTVTAFRGALAKTVPLWMVGSASMDRKEKGHTNVPRMPPMPAHEGFKQNKRAQGLKRAGSAQKGLLSCDNVDQITARMSDLSVREKEKASHQFVFFISPWLSWISPPPKRKRAVPASVR